MTAGSPVPRAVAQRLDEVLAAAGAPGAAATPLAALLRLLRDDDHAPTTLRDPTAGVDRHVADSLVALDLEAVRGAAVIADLGAGAGVPGLPLAACLPSARVVLVESAGRKAAFLERTVAAMGLGNAEVLAKRVEEWPAGAGVCDVVTARALAPLPVLVEYAAPLLRQGGTLVAWKGRRDEAEEADGQAAAAQTGLAVAEVRSVQPWPEAESRHLHLYLKVGSTPNGYPRRAGMARKRPIRAST